MTHLLGTIYINYLYSVTKHFENIIHILDLSFLIDSYSAHIYFSISISKHLYSFLNKFSDELSISLFLSHKVTCTKSNIQSLQFYWNSHSIKAHRGCLFADKLQISFHWSSSSLICSYWCKASWIKAASCCLLLS